jgi:hypothetical protein
MSGTLPLYCVVCICGQIAIEVVKFGACFGATAMPAPLLILIMMDIPSLNTSGRPALEREQQCADKINI